MQLEQNRQLREKPSMKVSHRTIVSIVVIIVAVVCVGLLVAAANNNFLEDIGGYPIPVTEKLEFNEITVNSQHVSLSVTALQLQEKSNWKNISITHAAIKDNATGDIVQDVNMEDNPVAAQLNCNTTVNIDLPTPLPSNRQYIVILVSGAGGAFYSQPLSFPQAT